ncbi:hypothetical protein J437_LFUL004968 [Ladona fulva]|uniref:Uncharacterized protein n=1 Tax=Ladona fulva TaxID=123851 RepID=A0A8K0JX88_LADFU|nr:hypothetical protein J437_LFUL004968 [Ladona fulva]
MGVLLTILPRMMYCAKLPSDTFTRLTPLWSLRKVKGADGDLSYICALRLPINSPVKQDILGNPMRSKALARRSAALEACKVLHQAKELDDDLMPVGKESFRAEVESDEEDDAEDEEEEDYEDESITENLTNKKHDSAEKDLSGKDICISNNVSESTNDNSPESRLETKEDESLITEESENEVGIKLPEEDMRPVDKKEMIMQETKLKGCKELKAKNKQQEVEYLEEEGEEEVPVGDGLSGMYGLDRPRPGTTKRRQYYYKRTADALTDCRPQPMFPAYLYNIGMKLVCPLPDEQNTRGRRIHPPEDSPRGFGILTLKEIPKICAFPIFTRSGEVRVCLEPSKPGVTSAKSWANSSMLYSVIEEQKVKALPNGIKEVVLPDPQQILLTGEQLAKALAFLNYTFAGVLRLQRYLMAFDPVASENSYLIVPTMTRKITEKDGDDEGSRETHQNKEWIEVDWDFVDLIYGCKGESKPAPVCEEERKSFQFDASLYHDAVVMPWYRNQDQPQYFYVAEICTHLSPKSSFPGSEYKTFEEYYFKKYAIQICNREQPLLDVDHTSARLNFLTPRYVNRKGVALPTSSEETKRAKRESLEQKQILVPELCCRHPFPASLWRKAVCLPCILYRLNALLLADQLRARVAREIGVGLEKVPEDFEWPPLDFGWSLADVLKRSKEAENQNMESKKGANPGKGEDKNDNRKEEKLSEEDDSDDVEGEDRKKAKKKGHKRKKRKKKNGEGSEDERSGDDDDTEDDASDKNEGEDWMEIGTWSNEMAMQAGDVPSLPDNVTMVEEGGRDGWGKGSVGGRGERVRYGSPSIWKGGGAPVEVFSGLENDLEGLETTDSSGDDDDDDAPEDEEGVEEAVLIPEEEVEDRGHHPRAEAVEVLDEDIVVESQLKAVTEAGEKNQVGLWKKNLKLQKKRGLKNTLSILKMLFQIIEE